MFQLVWIIKKNLHDSKIKTVPVDLKKLSNVVHNEQDSTH